MVSNINDAYINIFRECIVDTTVQTGYQLPHEMEAYLAILLGSFLDKPDFLPEHSFASAYWSLQNNPTMSAKQLADVCLFVVGVFPNLGIKHNIPHIYYKNIGISSYDIASKDMNSKLFSMLRDHFDIASKIISISTRPNPKNIRIF